MSNAVSVVIRSVGAYVPEKTVTNEDLAKIVDTSDEWIATRTGIRCRRIAENGLTGAGMGELAARQAIERARIDPAAIDLILAGSLAPDMLFPSNACRIQAALGLGGIAAMDVQAACSGFIYMLDVATAMIQSGRYRNALIVGAEHISPILDWKDRSTCVLFGDAAGAALLSPGQPGQRGVLSTLLRADGTNPSLLYMPAGGSARPASEETLLQREHYLRMNGKEIFKVACRHMEQAILDILAKEGLRVSDIDVMVPHQANLRIIDNLCDRLGFDRDRCITNIAEYGNTSAASIPLALREAVDSGRIRPGQVVLLVAFGAGLTWAASLVEWSA